MTTGRTDWKDLIEQLIATGREHLPDARELRDALRRTESTQGQDDTLATLGVFGAGIVLGAGLALLLAPKTGREVRQVIGKQAHDLKERVTTATKSAEATGT